MRWRERGRRIVTGAAAGGFLAGVGLAMAERPWDPEPRPAGFVERFVTPPPVALPAAALDSADALVRRQVAREAFPGAVLAVGNRALTQRLSAFGATGWDSTAAPASAASTRYDLASLTKVVATTAAVMALVEDGRMRLDEPVATYLPEFSGGERDAITIRHLLTHTGGLRAGASGLRDDVPAARVRRWVLSLPLALEPGADVLYSDVGFIVLWLAAERAAGEPLPRYLQRRVWGPLEMRETSVGVPSGCRRCAPSLHLEERNEPYAGGSYDELARRLDGVAGNAGAFSTAADLARFAGMIANEGRWGDVRVFQPRTVRLFTTPQPDAGTRALGWEVYCREGIVPDQTPCREVWAFGHTGVTGTSLWVHPESRTWVVLLANRTYLPHADVDMQRLRRRVFAAATGDTLR